MMIDELYIVVLRHLEKIRECMVAISTSNEDVF